MTHTVMIPSARRLMTSLRDIGYDLPAAVADLVDNSLDAGATRVDIDLRASWRGAFLRIADNGSGMSERRLDEAMRYGSNRSYGDQDLGNFGLGLKTASLSQCRQLTVATRSGASCPIRVRRWDLDQVELDDAWILQRPRVRDCREELTGPLRKRSTGTVVMWEKLDRVLGTRLREEAAIDRRLTALAEELRLHLAMVFHRFLSGEAKGRKLHLALNGERVAEWDPFARSEPLTQRLPRQRLSLETGGTVHSVVVTPYVLPNQQHFSSPEAHLEAAGPRRWNRQQGLYIYRRDRLIQSGGWNRLRTLDEHTKLARISVDLPTGAHDVFRTNVAKMTVGLPDQLRASLRVVITGVVARAQDTYRQRVQLVPNEAFCDADSQITLGGGIGDYWPVIHAVLERELADHPELLDRVLVALINEGAPSAAAEASDSSRISA